MKTKKKKSKEINFPNFILLAIKISLILFLILFLLGEINGLQDAGCTYFGNSCHKTNAFESNETLLVIFMNIYFLVFLATFISYVIAFGLNALKINDKIFSKYYLIFSIITISYWFIMINFASTHSYIWYNLDRVAIVALTILLFFLTKKLRKK